MRQFASAVAHNAQRSAARLLHEELDKQHRCLSNHKQSTPRVSEGLHVLHACLLQVRLLDFLRRVNGSLGRPEYEELLDYMGRDALGTETEALALQQGRLHETYANPFDWAGATFWCFTAVTTIGYGNYTPTHCMYTACIGYVPVYAHCIHCMRTGTATTRRSRRRAGWPPSSLRRSASQSASARARSSPAGCLGTWWGASVVGRLRRIVACARC